ncbi:hypothetical protein RhiirA1_459101 [Rhizophagus irregularis]|uniref:Uncharacterized protein n=1 Tax=Rhizophagus irregularis TaxID=588596 RepID=A0A2N0RUB0_9GLOM|nr:hypothetical protein RhiirA1_459101 [Rhizophagus irregularis]
MAFFLTEDDISQTIERNIGDSELVTNLLIKYQEEWKPLVKSLITLSQQILNTFKSVKDQLIDIEIINMPNMLKYQSKVAV